MEIAIATAIVMAMGITVLLGQRAAKWLVIALRARIASLGTTRLV